RGGALLRGDARAGARDEPRLSTANRGVVDVGVAHRQRLADQLDPTGVVEVVRDADGRPPRPDDQVRAVRPALELALREGQPQLDARALHVVVVVAGVEDPDTPAER